jgi:hypothetical protein
MKPGSETYAARIKDLEPDHEADAG